MNILKDLYEKSLAATEQNIRFWEDYVNNLKSLDFNIYANKLKVPALIPIGSRIFFRGEIKHTNEVTVSLGADYFAKCSIQQAEILRQHRIKDAESKLNAYIKEKEYLENQLSFNKTSHLQNEGEEIIEVYSEEEDKTWREKHRENVKKYKQGSAKEQEKTKEDITDEELWNRLEELELEEELENELIDSKAAVENNEKNSFIVNEENLLLKDNKKEIKLDNNIVNTIDELSSIININRNIDDKNDETETFKPASKLDLLQQVIDKQKELESKLSELKDRETPKSKTENDLISKLDEMDELDELEDEIDRLDEMLQTRSQVNEEGDEEEIKPKSVKLKKSISFADEDDSETLELTFKHSEAVANEEQYNSDMGIRKPSDIYEAFSNLFDNKTNSILKASKYTADDLNMPKQKTDKKVNFKSEFNTSYEYFDNNDVNNKTIVVKDVIEKSVVEEKIFDVSVRPTSLFKKKRMQNKKNNEE